MFKNILKKIRNKFLNPVLIKLNELEDRNNIILIKLNESEFKINSIINKMSLNEDIVTINGASFWLPNAPRDLLQNDILIKNNFVEFNVLEDIDKHLNYDSVVLDIGANIGNHSIYWGKITKVRKIYAFEPVLSTYHILEKNVELNNLSNKIKIFNIGLGDKTTYARINNFDPNNIGGTSLKEDKINGDMKIYALDDIDDIKNEVKIDLIKIDVEGFEKHVLNGGRHTIMKHYPIVFIESFPGEDNYNYTYNFFKEIGYSEPIMVHHFHYLWTFLKK